MRGKWVQREMRYLIWDFDGTLAFRKGRFTGALLHVLQKELPESSITIEQLRPHLASGLPWHTPNIYHPELNEPDAWWNAQLPIFAQAYQNCGIHQELAFTLAQQVRAAYCDPQYWYLYDDTLNSLETLAQRGWQHIILSNHVPELRYLVEHLGLAGLINELYCSAETGYEKPNAMAFQQVLDRLEQVDQIWMIGDSYAADIAGAAAVGIHGILVRSTHINAQLSCANLFEIVAHLEANRL